MYSSKYADVWFGYENDSLDLIIKEWKGPNLALFHRAILEREIFDGNQLKVGNRFWLAGIPFRIVDEDISRNSFVVMREDRGKQVEIYAYRLLRLLREINWRLLATCEIWGLLSTEKGVELRWSDLKVLELFRS